MFKFALNDEGRPSLYGTARDTDGVESFCEIGYMVTSELIAMSMVFELMADLPLIPDTARACKDCGHTCKSENINGMTIMFHTYIESVCIEGPDSDGPFVWAHGDEPAFRKDFA